MIEKPQEPASESRTFFELLGGTEKIRDIVERFYDIMDSDPRAAGIRAMHAPDLTSAREKLFMYLTGWTGGPQLYIERYGHPRLRARHLPFSIDESARDQWMYCMIKSLHENGVEEPVLTQLASLLYDLADMMRNRPG
jgi:hemoglobin